MFYLFLILLIVGVSLGVGLFVGGLFAQGWIYTEPSRQVLWGAPVTAAILFFFYSLWCVLDVFAGATPGDIPYDVLQRFSPSVDLLPTPARELWAVHKGGKAEHYVLRKFVRRPGDAGYEYRNAATDKPWNGSNVEEIILKSDGAETHYKAVEEKRREQGAYRQFISPDGWAMTEYDSGPSGLPSKFRFGRFVGNLVLNFLHLVLWFACLWLLMRFAWTHALVGAFVIWVAMTLIVLPMLLSYAAEVSQGRQARAPAPAALVRVGQSPRG